MHGVGFLKMGNSSRHEASANYNFVNGKCGVMAEMWRSSRWSWANDWGHWLTHSFIFHAHLSFFAINSLLAPTHVTLLSKGSLNPKKQTNKQRFSFEKSIAFAMQTVTGGFYILV